MNIPHSEEEKEEDFLEYLYTGWKSGVEILPQQVQMHLKLTGQERERLENGLLERGYLKKKNTKWRVPPYRTWKNAGRGMSFASS